MTHALRRSIVVASAAAIIGLAGTHASAIAANAAQPTISVEQIRKILEENPEIVINALNKHQQMQNQAREQQLAAAAGPIAKSIIAGDDQVGFVGAPTGKPVIEFFDYNCGFCKRFHSETVGKLVADGNVKVLLVHSPILGPGSERLAELSAAAHLQGKFGAAHDFLIHHSAKDVAEADKLIPDLVAAAKLDKAKFDRALADGSAKKQVAYNSDLSKQAKVSGTPMVYANGRAIPGAIPYETLKTILQ
ncbi:DsbA family protein [Sphingosinicella sp. BN140058]|uniref:DsbA family protein n=1 Tax=Sphingosinicella sp. BN140058 TaxID=1892855 RepID=UPI001010CCBE|nr:thioredoxin domain-containing protein [Sphingosinicella sp. BN140058]QAY80151.1 hypothetical protein ETR14_26270 [Sphingosinicella sp. BN140058]